MTIDEIKTEIRNIEKYYDFNHQTNDYDVLINLTEIANLILFQNKISYNKAIDDFAEKLKEMANNSSTKYIRLSEKETIVTYGVEQIVKQLKAGVKNE